MEDTIAVNRRTALKMAWDAGINTESGMLAFNLKLAGLDQPTPSYWYASDVSELIKAQPGETK